MAHRHPKWLCCAAALGTALAGCGDVELAGECGSMATGQVRVATWWSGESDESEVLAEAELKREFVNCNPSAEVVVTAYDDKQALLNDLPSMLPTRGTMEHPEAQGSQAEFDVVLVNAGSDALALAGCERHTHSEQMTDEERLTSSERARIQPLTDFGGQQLLERPFSSELDFLGRCREQAYAIPVGTHRLNTLYHNKELLAQVGCDAASLRSQASFRQVVDDLHQVLVMNASPSGQSCVRTPAEPVHSSGVFAVALDEPWAVSLFAFENVMAALHREDYERFWSGAKAPDVTERALPMLQQTLDKLDSDFVPYFVPHPADGTRLSVDWAQQQVHDGNAVFTVMGDWAADKWMDGSVGTVPFPGTDDIYVYTVDAFVVPLAAPNPEGALAWLRTVTSRRTQARYIPLKGGMSPRVDDPSFRNELRFYGGLPIYVPEHSFDALQTRIQSWVRNAMSGQRNDEAVTSYMEDQYCNLREARCEHDPPK